MFEVVIVVAVCAGTVIGYIAGLRHAGVTRDISIGEGAAEAIRHAYARGKGEGRREGEEVTRYWRTIAVQAFPELAIYAAEPGGALRVVDQKEGEGGGGAG